MARIKFLDVLEETKQKPAFRSEDRPYSSERSEARERMERFDNSSRESFRDIHNEGPAREYRTPSAFPRETRSSQSFIPRKSFEKTFEKEEEPNSKIIWAASLVLFLAALFFFGGYWAARFQQKVETEIPSMPETISPAPIMIDPAPVSEPVYPKAEAARPIPVIKPLTAAPVKKAAPKKSTSIGKGEYVIQVAAFTQLDKARTYEQTLAAAFGTKGGENVYISENYMGSNNDKKIFRVRVRNGFRSEAEAKKSISTITSVLPVTDTELRIIKLDQ